LVTSGLPSALAIVKSTRNFNHESPAASASPRGLKKQVPKSETSGPETTAQGDLGAGQRRPQVGEGITSAAVCVHLRETAVGRAHALSRRCNLRFDVRQQHLVPFPAHIPAGHVFALNRCRARHPLEGPAKLDLNDPPSVALQDLLQGALEQLAV
jgi:hypothetical protein